MRIIFLTSSLSSGGAERVASTLANAWAARGDLVTVVPTFSGGGRPFYQVDASVELLYLAELVGFTHHCGKHYLQRLFALRRLVRERKPDVVISFLPNVNIAALAATAFTGVPCLIGERSDPSMQPIGTVWRTACALLYRFATAVTVQTEAVATSIRRVYGGLRHVVVLPNPVPQALLAWEAKADRARQRHILLSLGRLAPEKQLGSIIDCFQQLAPGVSRLGLRHLGRWPTARHLAGADRRVSAGGACTA